MNIAPPDHGQGPPLALANLIASRRPVLGEEDGQGLVILPHACPTERMLRFACEGAPGVMLVGATEEWLLSRLPDGVARLPLADMPAPLAAAVAAHALGPLCRAAGRLTDSATRLGDLIDAEPPGLRTLSLAAPDMPDGPCSTALMLDPIACRRLEAALADLPPDPTAAIAEATPLRLRALVGRQALTAEELAALAPGAVILLRANPDDLVELTVGERFTRLGYGYLEAGTVTLDAIGGEPMGDDADPDTGADDMSAGEQDDVEAGEDEIDLEDLEVRLDFVIGRASLRVAELRELAPGSTVTLEEGESREVAIYASGRRLGTGELVEIGGATGVRIARINRRADG